MAKATNGKEVFAGFFDEGAFTKLFNDSAVSAAFGSACGNPVYAICQDGAALAASDVDKMIKVLELSAKTGNPVVTFYNSKGALLEEGLKALEASANLNAAIAKISGVVPQIAVVTGICGGSSALAATTADICIMSQDAQLFLTAPFTSSANGDNVKDAGSAEFAQKAGVATITTNTAEEAAKKAAELIGVLPSNNLTGAAIFESVAPKGNYTLTKYDAKAAVDTVVDADSNIELYAEFGKNVYTAIATVGGSVVGVVSTAGQDESMCKPCVSKIARFVRICDAFGMPVITIINTDGFAKSCSQDLSGGLRHAARLAGTYADATTAKIAIVTGKAVGTAYTALANADITIAVNGCTIAPVEPSVAASVLYKEEIDAGNNIAADTNKKAAEYAKEVCSASAAVNAGIADFAVEQADIRSTLSAALDMLSTKRVQRLPKKHGNMSL